MPIIFITGYGDMPMTVRAMKAGAVEFSTKPFGDDVLLNAIRHVLERSKGVLDREAEAALLRERHASLTRREREVMARVVSGLLKQVGGELGISEVTVKAHRRQVMHKMGAESVADLVTMAVRLGIRSAPISSAPVAGLPNSPKALSSSFIHRQIHFPNESIRKYRRYLRPIASPPDSALIRTLSCFSFMRGCCSN